MPNRLHEIHDPIHGFIRLDDVVTSPSNIYHDSIRGFVPAPGDRNSSYWRTVLRTAALCHDTGHLPFSHAAEKDLLPPGIRHEHLSTDLILSRKNRGGPGVF